MSSAGKVENYPYQQSGTITAKLYNFEIGRFDLKPEHISFLSNAISPMLRKGGSISLVGLTSRTGSEGSNQILSQNRSKAVINLLRRQVPNNFQVTFEVAMGERAAAFAGVRDGVEQENWRAVVISAWNKPTPPPPPPPPPPIQKNRSEVDVGEYDDSDFLDTLGKVLDITGALDTGLSITHWALPALLEGGLIAAGAASAFLSEMLALGGGHFEAFQKINRERFFGGLSIALVMTVNARSKDEIKSKYYYYDPQRFYNSVYPEKAKAFLALHNAGVLVGIGKGNSLSDLERSNFRSFLRSKLTREQRQRFSGMGSVAAWNPRIRTEYFELLAAKNREIMLNNNLKIRIR